MVPARNLLRRHFDTYGGAASFEGTHLIIPPYSDHYHHPMAGEEQPPTASKESSAAAADDSWLQLSIGSPSSAAAPSPPMTSPGPASRSVELELFAPRPMPVASGMMVPMMPVFRPPWGFWGHVNSMMGGSSSNSPAPPPPPPPVMMRWRVVSPPPSRRQAAGLWFVLQASQNQVREPFLPQIPKSYLRIKDGRMSVKVLMKYLVNKLGLDDESEVEISCRGQPLFPYLTLQHVRDNIWCVSEEVAFLRDTPNAEHVMTLQYGRSP